MSPTDRTVVASVQDSTTSLVELGGTHWKEGPYQCSLCRDRNPSVHFIQTMFLLCQSEKGHIYMQHIRVIESSVWNHGSVFQCAGYSPMAKQYFEYMFWFWLCRICHDSSTIWIYILDVCIVQCQCTESYWQLHSSAASWVGRWLCNAMQCNASQLPSTFPCNAQDMWQIPQFWLIIPLIGSAHRHKYWSCSTHIEHHSSYFTLLLDQLICTAQKWWRGRTIVYIIIKSSSQSW